MFPYIVTLLLTITCCCTSGSPTLTNLHVYSIDKLLNSLVDRCQNQFLASQIKEKISECNLIVPPFSSKQMQCLIFYDMSRQLCDAIDSTKHISQEELYKADNIDIMCDKTAKTWKFSNLTDIPNYRTIAESVFYKPERCKRVCEVPDVLSDDTNNFCKFYKWGFSEIMKIQVSTPTDDEKSTNNEVVNTVPGQVVNTDIKVNTLNTANNTVASITKNREINVSTRVRESDPSEIQTTIKNVHENNSTEVVKLKTPLKVDVSGLENQQASKTSEVNAPLQSADGTINNVEHSVVVQKPDVSDNLNIEKTFPQEEEPPKKDDIEKEDQLFNNQKDMPKDEKDAIIDDIEDDADSEEDKQDLQDDSEISIGKADPQNPEEEKKDNINNNVPLITSYAAVKSQDFISKIPQDDFPEDDDHFISFFLTAVIVVILLYILYHNKNKFTKVVLGLIVEGRQHGRRRNSRGHAYRRLDTLEQAMSTNMPAPPSKIIY